MALDFEACRYRPDGPPQLDLAAGLREIVGLVLREAAVLTAPGGVLGLGGAWALTRFLSGLLYGVSPTDPGAFLAVGLVLAAASLASAWLPARRAARLDPIRALRHE